MSRELLFCANTAAIIVVTMVAAYLFAGQIRLHQIKGIMSNGLEALGEEYNQRRLQRELKKYTKTVSIKMGLADKVELHVIDKSNIRRYIPIMNFYVLLLISLAVFALAFASVYKILYFVPSSLVISCIFFFLPTMILDIMGKYNSDLIRRRLAHFISVLLRWTAVKEDIFYAFEKSADSGIGEPLKTFIEDMVIQVKRGMDPITALDILQMKVDNAQFSTFIHNIKQSVKFKGDIGVLLNNMEEQFYKIEEEFNERNISTARDRILNLGVMVAVIFFGYLLLKLNPKVYAYYMGTTAGKMLLTLFTMLYAAGVYVFTKISTFNH